MKEYIIEIGLSGWLTAIIFSLAFTIITNYVKEKREIKSAKSSLKFEMMQNLKYLGLIYWKHDNSEKFPRDIHFANINLYPTYAGIILKKYPEVGNNLLELFSAFDEVIKTKSVISNREDAFYFLDYAKNINNKLKLGIDNREIEKVLNIDYSIR